LSSEKRFGQKKALFPEYMGYGPRREFADPYINFEGCSFFPFFFLLEGVAPGCYPPLREINSFTPSKGGILFMEGLPPTSDVSVRRGANLVPVNGGEGRVPPVNYGYGLHVPEGFAKLIKAIEIREGPAALRYKAGEVIRLMVRKQP